MMLTTTTTKATHRPTAPIATSGISRVRRYRKASSNAYISWTLLGIDHRLGDGLPKVINDMGRREATEQYHGRQDLRDSTVALVFLNRRQDGFGVTRHFDLVPALQHLPPRTDQVGGPHHPPCTSCRTCSSLARRHTFHTEAGCLRRLSRRPAAENSIRTSPQTSHATPPGLDSPKNHRIQARKFGVQISERAGFFRAARRVVFGIEIQHDVAVGV